MFKAAIAGEPHLARERLNFRVILNPHSLGSLA
jgi:hypothetical protein